MKKIIMRAFSLVELMVTLIVVSCLIAAMAPVITKRLKSNTITIGGQTGELSMDCTKFGPSCGLCYPNKCVSCVKSCTENQALDIAQCSCIECGEKYGSTCLRCDVESCSKCADTNYIDNGICKTCDSGNYCDGTNSTICPAGYYCTDGTKTECPYGTYNDTTGSSSSSSCKSCSSKTANCANCNITTGVCSACASGYDLSADGCKNKDFIYTYTGSHTKTTMDGYIRVLLTSSGTFTSNNTVNAKIFLIGGGGGGGGANGSGSAGGRGCSGYSTQTEFTLSENKGWSVTIGAGGAGGSRGWGSSGTGGTGSNGGSTSFDSISASGGGGGIGKGKSGSCAGGSAVTFAEMKFASKSGVNTGYGGSAGSGQYSCGWDGGEVLCGHGGSNGYSGAAVIIVD